MWKREREVKCKPYKCCCCFLFIYLFILFLYVCLFFANVSDIFMFFGYFFIVCFFFVFFTHRHTVVDLREIYNKPFSFQERQTDRQTDRQRVRQTHRQRKEGNVLFNDALSTFYLQLYSVRHMVNDHSDSTDIETVPWKESTSHYNHFNTNGIPV